MLIAIPVGDGKLFPHFGHCSRFALVEADPERKIILDETVLDAPPHEPGLLPKWLAERGVQLVIAGGMGGRALELMAENKIDVVVGAPVETTQALVRAYLDGSLRSGLNGCDH